MRYKNIRTQSLCLFIVILTIFMILFTACPQPDISKKGKGLEETPAMLYKSFRASSPEANGGAAPELAKDVDLSPFFPKPGDQGMIGSCTGWSVAYACKSYHENIERKWGVNANEHLFSPSFIYNQINGGSDGGAPIETAIAVVIEKGCASFSTMPYTENLQTQPNQNAFNEAVQYKAKSFARVDYNNLAAVKEVLSRGNPVIIGMMIYENFYEYKGGVLTSSSGALLGGHAMCVVGYDDGKKAFKIINSWSTYWGEGGYGWISYDLFKKEVKVCVVIYDDVASNPKEAAVPVNIEASRGSFADKIEVTWEKAKHAASYKVFRSKEINQNFKEIANTKGTKFIDTEDIKPGVIYYYAVKSVNENGESEFSEAAKGFAGSLEQEIGIPQKFEGLFSEGAVYLTWQKIENIDGYYVYGFDSEKKNFLRLGSTKNINFKDSRAFKNGETLWYIVTAFKGQKESKPSPSISITVVIEEKPEYKPLKAPLHIKASEGDYEDKIIVSWDAVGGAESYDLYKWNHKEEKWFSYQEVKEVSYTDAQIGNPFEYYAVVAKNQYVKSEPSDLAYGYIKEHEKEVKKEEVVYDDEEYYDDREFEDTDFTDEKLYDDDKVYEDEQQKTYDGFFEDTSVIDEKWKKEEEEFFDTEEEKEEFFDSEEEKEQFFESEEEKEKFFESEEEEDKFFDSDEKSEENKGDDEFFDSEEEDDEFFE